MSNAIFLRLVLAAVFCMALAACAAPGYDRMDSSPPEGMTIAQGQRLDQAWVQADADFSSYRAVLIEPAEIEFDPAWGRPSERTGSRLANPQVDIDGTRKEMQSVIDRAVRKTLNEDARFELVDESGPGVLRLQPSVDQLFITAIDPMKIATRVEQFIRSSGRGIAGIEISDSESGQPLLITADWRETRRYEPLRVASPGLTANDFRDWYRRFLKDSLELIHHGAD